jgi:broad-specificity NMP kinase
MSLTSVTFDPGARLREIGRFAFASTALTQISLPSGVCFISGMAFCASSLNNITFSGISDHFRIVGLFVRYLSGECLIRYFGDEERVVIESSVVVICEGCFSGCALVKSVTFDCDSKLSRIEKWAFAGSGLISIHLPSSVEVLCESCFSWCTSLTSVTFDCDSKLSRIEKWAFRGSALVSIHLPSSVEVLCEECFALCKSLTSVTFDCDSRLSRIEQGAFSRSALISIHLPSSVEVLCTQCLSVCTRLP